MAMFRDIYGVGVIRPAFQQLQPNLCILVMSCEVETAPYVERIISLSCVGNVSPSRTFSSGLYSAVHSVSNVPEQARLQAEVSPHLRLMHPPLRS